MDHKSTMCIDISQEKKETFLKTAESLGVSHGELFEDYQDNYLASQEDQEYRNLVNTGIFMGYNEGKVRDKAENVERLTLGYSNHD